MTNHPYVEEVTYTCGNAPVFTEQGDWYGSFYSYFCFDPNEAEPNSYNSVIVADKDFFSFFKLQLKAGSWPTDATPYSYMVNATCLQTLGYTDLLERPIYIKGQASQARVCGVIKDYLYAPMQYPILPLFFTTYENPMVKDGQYLSDSVSFFVLHHIRKSDGKRLRASLPYLCPLCKRT